MRGTSTESHQLEVGDKVEIILRKTDPCSEYTGRVGTIERFDEEGGLRLGFGDTHDGLRVVPSEVRLFETAAGIRPFPELPLARDHRVKPVATAMLSARHPIYTGKIEQAIAAGDAADRLIGIQRLKVDHAAVRRAAEAAALVDDNDGCFERIRGYEAMQPWEQDSHGYPSSDYEDCAYWVKRTEAIVEALKILTPESDNEGETR